MAKFLFKFTQLFQRVLTLLFGGRTCRSAGWIFGAWFDGQTNAANVEVFLEAIQLEEVGEFEGADVAPGVADFLLQITHNLNEIGEGEASAVPSWLHHRRSRSVPVTEEWESTSVL